MDSNISPHLRQLQQQPQRPVDRQQQQSSGSGELQSRRVRQAGDDGHVMRQYSPGHQQTEEHQ
ncbi:hypothetical protein [Polaromonas sp. A23]|uniref:hypothetical protein n=1 Tax=Polaromonas sp. A23 TaxID=1944133 RepID=UPI0011157750|nr:hypothetical protein [Polaromonas sp. A23]